jgi:dihydrofolate reductase/thymidylate synthase
MNFSAIFASTTTGGIGYYGDSKVGTIPWPRIMKDLNFFKKTTTETCNPDKQNAVIMGRGTWDSLPKDYRPLPGRQNAVITSRPLHDDYVGRAFVFPSLQEALEYFAKDEMVERVFVCGGARLYDEAFNHPDCEAVYHTLVNTTVACDVSVNFFPLFTQFQQTDDFGGVQKTKDGLEFYITCNKRIMKK